MAWRAAAPHLRSCASSHSNIWRGRGMFPSRWIALRWLLYPALHCFNTIAARAMENVKCVVVGDGSIGKTCLLISYTSNTFSDDYIPTVFDTYSASVMVDSRAVSLGLWDTAGQEEYDRLRPLSYPQTDVFFVCFSVINPHSFSNVKSKWIPEIKAFAPAESSIVLVGLKCDLRRDPSTLAKLASSGEHCITQAEGRALAAEMGVGTYVECSSYTGEGVKEVFDAGVRFVLGKRRPRSENRRRTTLCTVL